MKSAWSLPTNYIYSSPESFLYPNVCSSSREAAWEGLLLSHPSYTLPLFSHKEREGYSIKVNPSLRLVIGGMKGEAKQPVAQMKDK